MPEGDTVFLTCHRLHGALAGRVLSHGDLRHPRLALVELAGRRLTEVHPAGKHLLMRFDDGHTLHSHLRMDGAWHLYRPGDRWRRPAHQVRAVLAVPERTAVGFHLHDMHWLPTDQEHRLIGHLGPDLLSPDWGPELEAEAVRRLTADPGRELGLALLDQSVMAGLGNLYRTEICFLLRRRPDTPVSEVDPQRVVRLARALLVRNAWRPQQSTTGELRPGAQHWVYDRRTCLRCGSRVRHGEQGSGVTARETYYCPVCQR